MQSTLCHGVTLKGASCTKRTKDPSQLCHIHLKKASSDKAPVSSQQVPSPNPETQDECCVCYDMMPVSDALKKCKHMLCKSCLANMRSQVCPLCRTPIEMDKKTKKKIERRRAEDSLERNMAVAVQLQNEAQLDNPALNGIPSLSIGMFPTQILDFFLRDRQQALDLHQFRLSLYRLFNE
jgi:hypothetical protein